MALRYYNLLVLAMLALVLVASVNAKDRIFGNRVFDGPWEPLEPNNPRRIELGKLAVDLYNKQAKTKLVFETVGKVETRYSLTMEYFYRIHLIAKNGNTFEQYRACIDENAYEGHTDLVSFGIIPAPYLAPLPLHIYPGHGLGK